MTQADPLQLAPLVLYRLDFVWSRVRRRLDGLTQEEYLWEPVPGCWSVRPNDDGVWRVQMGERDIQPAPVTTIAWRMWHIGSDCLAAYTERGLGDWPLAVKDLEWYADVSDALDAMDTAWAAFRKGLDALGEDGMRQPIGPIWGPQHADKPWAALALHLLDETSHHGAEIALLRDLYANRPAPTPGRH